MVLGLSQFIKSSIGDLQSTDQGGLSTFGGEVQLISTAIEKSNERGLILIDELARGTNPEEGYAISKGHSRVFKKSRNPLSTNYYSL